MSSCFSVPPSMSYHSELRAGELWGVYSNSLCDPADLRQVLVLLGAREDLPRTEGYISSLDDDEIGFMYWRVVSLRMGKGIDVLDDYRFPIGSQRLQLRRLA